MMSQDLQNVSLAGKNKIRKKKEKGYFCKNHGYFYKCIKYTLRVESQRALSLGKNNALRCYIKLCFEALGGV